MPENRVRMHFIIHILHLKLHELTFHIYRPRIESRYPRLKSRQNMNSMFSPSKLLFLNFNVYKLLLTSKASQCIQIIRLLVDQQRHALIPRLKLLRLINISILIHMKCPHTHSKRQFEPAGQELSSIPVRLLYLYQVQRSSSLSHHRSVYFPCENFSRIWYFT